MKTRQLQTPTQNPYRFINFILFLGIAICNSLPVHTFTAVSQIISQKYLVSILIVNLSHLAYLLLYVVMFLPSNYLIQIKGLKYSTLLSQILLCIGLIMRCMINIDFIYFSIGTFLCSVGFSFNINAINAFPSIWFSQNKIYFVKSILIFFLIISDMIGYFISQFFITKQSSRGDIFVTLLVESVLIIAVQIVGMIFIKDKPNKPQNKDFLKSIAKLFSNNNYLIILMSQTIIFIYLNLLFISMAKFQSMFKLSARAWKIALLLTAASGLISVCSNTLFFSDKYKKKLIALSILLLLSQTLLWVSFEISNQWLTYFSAIIIGFSIFPLICALTDYACQVSFPIGQGMSGGSTFFTGYFFGTIIPLLLAIYWGFNSQKYKLRITMVIEIIFILMSLVFILMTSEDLKRKSYEENKSIDLKVRLISEQTKFIQLGNQENQQKE